MLETHPFAKYGDPCSYKTHVKAEVLHASNFYAMCISYSSLTKTRKVLEKAIQIPCGFFHGKPVKFAKFSVGISYLAPSR